MICGFIVRGPEQKLMVLRGIGPSLATGAAPVSDALADPTLLISSPNGAVSYTDNWIDVPYPINAYSWSAVDGTGLAPTNQFEAATLLYFDPGAFTVALAGLNQTTGTGVVEAYDLAPETSSLVNISTRGHVGIGDGVLIGGFILSADQLTRVVIRAIGPSLTDGGVAGALEDPMLELHDSNGDLIAQNDDWTQDDSALQATGLAPKNSRESAILLQLGPGSYTAIVLGKDNSSGVGLVEVYNLDAKDP
jgi:hypothetical protein